eukprot:1089990_1
MEVAVVDLFDLAEAVVNSTDEVQTDDGWTFPVLSNIGYSTNPTPSPTKPPLPNLETHDPTKRPTSDPTTGKPTLAPTPRDIHCNDDPIATDIDGEYEYIVHISELSVVRFDTCRTINPFDIFMTDTRNATNYSCTRCGSICYKPSQYTVTLPASTYLMTIDGPHAFEMICVPKTFTDAPTKAPVTSRPTTTPTGYPTRNPTTAHPTKKAHPVYNASFPGKGGPFSGTTFLGDPFGGFTSFIEVQVYDREKVLGVTALCSDCFVWQYRVSGGVWTDINHANNADISVYNTKVAGDEAGMTTYKSKLTVQSIRRLKAGRCVQQDDTRIFTPGKEYELRLKFLVNTEEYFVSETSDVLQIETNGLPSGGFCIIQNLENLAPLMEYNLYCEGWNNADNLEFNALLGDAPMSQTYVDDARLLKSIAPTGEVSITVLVKEKGVNNAITCYAIDAIFKSLSAAIDDKLSANSTQNVSAIIDDILTDVSRVTNETSLSDNPDVATVIVALVDDIYTKNLTTKTEAAQVVDDVVSNIIAGSAMSTFDFDIVINRDNASSNFTWSVFQGDSIATELSTIASITENTDIVDVSTTTTTLVEAYLPQVLDAIDVFTAGASADDDALEGQLYNIAKQTQTLITNLDSTLASSKASLEAMVSGGSTEDIDVEAVDNLNGLAQQLVEASALSAVKALSNSDAGVAFNYEQIEYNEDGTVANKKVIVATKLDANVIDYSDTSQEIELPKCGSTEQNIALPLAFMQQQDGMVDCAFMVSTSSNFISLTQSDRAQQSDVISINLFAEEGRRRRLIEFESDACYPYLITIATTEGYSIYAKDILKMTLGVEAPFPSCDFWETGNSSWDTSGCFVYKINDESITCGCTHLTTFSLSADDILPQTNIVSRLNFKNITADNLWKYPTVWLICFSIFVVFAIICVIDPRSKTVADRHILAYEDIIYKSFQQKHLFKDIVGKEIHYYSKHLPNGTYLGQGWKKMVRDSEDAKTVCTLQWNLFVSYLRNMHVLLSVFGRTDGTNFSARQRLACFYMYVCNIMMVTATFYGTAQSNIAKDILASLFISLCGTVPSTILKMMLVKAKPTTIKTEKKPKSAPAVDIDEGKQPETNDNDWNTDWVKEAWKGHKKEGTIRVAHFDENLTKLIANKGHEEHVKAVSEIRLYLFNKRFPLPHKCKKIAWTILILWSIAATVITIIYGLSFDLEMEAEADPANPNVALIEAMDCWNSTLSLQLEDRLSREKFLQDSMRQDVLNAASYGGSDSTSWLVSIFQSLLQSMLVWNPVTIYIKTWIAVWLFTWNVEPVAGAGNVVKLCKKCLLGKKEDSEVAIEEKLSDQVAAHTAESSKTAGETQVAVVAHAGRPMDLISFLGNEKWIIDDTQQNDDDVEVVLAETEPDNDHETVVELEVLAKTDETAVVSGEEDNATAKTETDDAKDGDDVTQQTQTDANVVTGEEDNAAAKSQMSSDEEDGAADDLVALALKYEESNDKPEAIKDTSDDKEEKEDANVSKEDDAVDKEKNNDYLD